MASQNDNNNNNNEVIPSADVEQGVSSCRSPTAAEDGAREDPSPQMVSLPETSQNAAEISSTSLPLHDDIAAKLGALEPPLTKSEIRRDRLLETIANNKLIMAANILVLFLVVAVGALWFFFAVGWQTLCTPRTDCEPRNTVYNISIHIMTGLFTWMSNVVMPWRWAQALHTWGWSKPHRSNKEGLDLYGLPTDDPWYHVPKQKRKVILFFLLFNCFFQYANQVCRGIYYSFELADTFPGNFWTSVWFVLSLLWAVIGALLFWKHTSIVRETDKERFGPGPIEMIQDMYVAFQKKRRGEDDKNDSDDNDSGDVETASTGNESIPVSPVVGTNLGQEDSDASRQAQTDSSAADSSAAETIEEARL